MSGPPPFESQNAAAHWHLLVAGVQYGPYPEEMFRQFAREGRITPSTNVRRGISGPWLLAESVPGLFPPVAPPLPSLIAQDVDYLPQVRTEVVREIRLPIKNARERSNDLRFFTAIGATVSNVLGFFTPIVSIPILGGMSYFSVLQLQLQHGFGLKGVSTLLVLTAWIVSAIAAATRLYGMLWYSALANFAAVILTFANYQTAFSNMRGEDRDIAIIAAVAVHLDYGLALVVLAGIAQLVAVIHSFGASKRRSASTRIIRRDHLELPPPTWLDE